jgi:hypothetical protein
VAVEDLVSKPGIVAKARRGLRRGRRETSTSAPCAPAPQATSLCRPVASRRDHRIAHRKHRHAVGAGDQHAAFLAAGRPAKLGQSLSGVRVQLGRFRLGGLCFGAMGRPVLQWGPATIAARPGVSRASPHVPPGRDLGLWLLGSELPISMRPGFPDTAAGFDRRLRIPI